MVSMPEYIMGIGGVYLCFIEAHGNHFVGTIAAHSGLTGDGKKTFCCFDLFEYPYDSNLTITVLLVDPPVEGGVLL